MKIASSDVITEAFYKLTGNLLAGSETNVHPLTHPPGEVVKGATQPISLHFCVTSHEDHMHCYKVSTSACLGTWTGADSGSTTAPLVNS